MKFHWKVLIWMVAGALAGYLLQRFLDGPAWSGATWRDADEGIELVDTVAGSPIAKLELGAGGVVVAALVDKGTPEETRVPLRTPADFDQLLARSSYGDVLWLELPDEKLRMMTLAMDPDSDLATAVAPLDFLADIFMALLKMLIVPIVLTSIITGVAGVGNLGDLRRLGAKTFAYYISTSLLAIVVGQILVTIFRPGDGAPLGLAELDREASQPDASFIGVLKRMVPENVFESMGDNGAMLSIIFFALIFGFFLMRTPDPHRERALGMFEALFQVVLRMAEGIMKLLPYGVFCLLARVVAKTGFGVFEPLFFYMLLVTAALLIHAAVTLPLIVVIFGRMSPLRWFKAMSPALMTAFSTSSSSLTLPVTLDTVAQYYASTGTFELTFAIQAQVVIMALLASVGAAGIPSAGLVMMLTILAALGLPLEGAALLLAVDRPLDMLRTVVNVWSDSCGAAIIARSEGEEGPLRAGVPG